MLKKDEIRYISAQPDELYFIWQTEIYLTNFISLGIHPENCIALFGSKPDMQASAELRVLQEKFPTVDIRIYQDTRDVNGIDYQASIQPHLIDKALEHSPSLENALTFFHDSDIAFRRLPNFDSIEMDHPNACVLSDTSDYTGYEYLRTSCMIISADNSEIPGNELVLKMCAIVGIDIDTLRANELQSGGAQYLLKGVGRAYWQKVYQDSIAINKLFQDYAVDRTLPKPLDDYIQVWTAGMWSYLWNLWFFGLETVVHPELDFCFANASSSNSSPIMHMTGLEGEQKHNLYNKSDWCVNSPIAMLEKQPFLFDHCTQGSVAKEYTDLIYRTAGVERPGIGPTVAAKNWRLLAWSVLSDYDIWDVEQFEFIADTQASVVRQFNSSNAYSDCQLTSTKAVEDQTIWRIHPQSENGCKAFFSIGVELDQPAQPETIKITQAQSPHVATVAILQYMLDDGRWTTVDVAKLDPGLINQTIYYRSDLGHKSTGWRIIADATSSNFAWDIHRLAFMANNQEQIGKPFSSGFAKSENSTNFGPANAFRCDSALWGGRVNARQQFWLGMDVTQCISVNRVVLEQGEEHWAERINIQVKDEDGVWFNYRSVENLHPGSNTIILF